MKRHGWLGWLVFVGLATVLAASEGTMRVSKPAVQDEILAVIEAQLGAFRAGEAAKAYRYASEGLRAQMTAVAFARMVQRNYPEIWQSTRAEFGIVRDDGERAALVVRVFAKEGDATYDYVLFTKKPAGELAACCAAIRNRRPALNELFLFPLSLNLSPPGSGDAFGLTKD